MSDSKPADDVASYAAEVRAALAHLPDAEREILLEDLESHLDEVASETGVPLQDRLGRPSEYAAELRAAYGGGDPAGGRARKPLRTWAQSLVTAVIGTNAYRAVMALLPELRPGWWVLRAYLAVLFLAFLFRGGHNLRPIPDPFTSFGLVQILATLGAIAISVRIGRRGIPSGGVWRGAALAGNLGIALVALPVLAEMSTSHAYPLPMDSGSSAVVYRAGYFSPGLTNIYPYTKDGTPLKDVLLYDQNGGPLVVMTRDPSIITDFPFGADGRQILNEYPHNQRHSYGDPILPPRVALPPGSAPTPTP